MCLSGPSVSRSCDDVHKGMYIRSVRCWYLEDTANLLVKGCRILRGEHREHQISCNVWKIGAPEPIHHYPQNAAATAVPLLCLPSAGIIGICAGFFTAQLGLLPLVV